MLKQIETNMLKQFNFGEIIKIINIMNPCLPFVVKMSHKIKETKKKRYGYKRFFRTKSHFV